MADFGKKFYNILRIHHEQGLRIDVLDLNERQKEAMRRVDDLVLHYQSNPLMNVQQYLRNKYGMTPQECLRYNRALNFVCGMFTKGNREMVRYKVNHYADTMVRIGEQTGDWHPIDKALEKIIKVNQLDQPDPAESIEENMPKLGYVLSVDPSQARQGAKQLTDQQRAALFKKYGAKQDVWAQLLSEGHGHGSDYDPETGQYDRRQAMKNHAEDAEWEEGLENEWEKELEEDGLKMEE